jgi:Trk K+ transport system NAD-binding subunit
MSTLGFGDITFHSDLGRVYSMVVLLSGIVLLLIVLPFAFIRFFYAPWLDARLRRQAPRSVPDDTRDHVIVCRNDSIAPGLIRKLDHASIPYFLIEPDPVVALQLADGGLSVVSCDIDSSDTFRRLRAADARLVFANAADTVNTNIALTVRDASPEVCILALAEEDDSVDILELSGVTQVLPLKRRLGEHLAARVTIGTRSPHVVGSFANLLIAEFVIPGTSLAGKTLQESRLRERTGVDAVGIWEHGTLHPTRPDYRFTDHSIPVAVGTPEEMERLDDMLGSPDGPLAPVLVIGGGKVGRAAARALGSRGLQVHVVEKEERVGASLEPDADRVVCGDAADRAVLEAAGLREASAVVLTTNDDAINIYLAVYCRRLKPEVNIVSRITHERNVEAIYRAGADSVLSYASLGGEYVISRVLGREPVMIGEGVDVFSVPVPESLAGRPLRESRIRERSGLLVVALQNDAAEHVRPSPSMKLPAGARLLLLGTAEQRERFQQSFE